MFAASTPAVDSSTGALNVGWAMATEESPRVKTVATKAKQRFIEDP